MTSVSAHELDLTEMGEPSTFGAEDYLTVFYAPACKPDGTPNLDAFDRDSRRLVFVKLVGQYNDQFIVIEQEEANATYEHLNANGGVIVSGKHFENCQPIRVAYRLPSVATDILRRFG